MHGVPARVPCSRPLPHRPVTHTHGPSRARAAGLRRAFDPSRRRVRTPGCLPLATPRARRRAALACEARLRRAVRRARRRARRLPRRSRIEAARQAALHRTARAG
eukprot:2953409-Prymnesium_polylepis.1